MWNTVVLKKKPRNEGSRLGLYIMKNLDFIQRVMQLLRLLLIGGTPWLDLFLSKVILVDSNEWVGEKMIRWDGLDSVVKIEETGLALLCSK